jgi:hypothetical protein
MLILGSTRCPLCLKSIALSLTLQFNRVTLIEITANSTVPEMKVRLNFVQEFDSLKSIRMLEYARLLIAHKPDGKHGKRHGTVYKSDHFACLAYWTPRRTLVVEEIPLVNAINFM